MGRKHWPGGKTWSALCWLQQLLLDLTSDQTGEWTLIKQTVIAGLVYGSKW